MIDRQEVEKIAKLSKIQFNEEQLKKLQKDMSDILEYVKIIESVNTNAIQDLERNKGQMREDEETASLPVEEILKNAPKQQKTYFVVPHILD